MTTTDALTDWIPLYLQRGHVHWCYMGQERFVEPFCQDTLQKLAVKPFNQLFRQRTELSVLTERALSHPGLPLQGIIFHSSRCGSTLAAQALAALSDSVVLSEPPAIDTFLQWLTASPDFDKQAGEALLHDLTAALGQPRRAQDQRLFLKTDCWHICHIGRILSAFPGTPWLFLYRDPLEVLVSQARMPSSYLIPGSMIAHGLYPPEQLFNQPLEHGAWVLSHILNAAIQALQTYPGGLLVNYSELPTALTTRLAPHFKLHLNGSDLTAWQQTTARHSKNPQQTFTADSADKQHAADEAIRAIAARWLDGPYAVLEQMRLERLAGYAR
jgi:hypothetical protein